MTILKLVNKSILLSASFILGTLVLGSCDHSNSDIDNDVYAQVGNEKLYYNDINTLIPEGTSQSDSLEIAETFVKKWITNALIYETANEELGDDNEIEEMVEEYKKELVIHKYEQNLLNKKFSQTPSEDELKNYYESNKELLALPNPIVKGMALKIPSSTKNIDVARKMMKSANDGNEDELEKWSLRNSASFIYFGNDWIYLSELANNIPVVSELNLDKELKDHRCIELHDNDFVYLLRFSDIKLKGENEPYEMAKQRIATLIINQRKQDFIRKMENDIYDKGLKNKKFKIQLK